MLLIIAMAMAACGTGVAVGQKGTTGADRSHAEAVASTRATPLTQFVVSAPPGFTSEARDPTSGELTGSQTLSGAENSMCDLGLNSTWHGQSVLGLHATGPKSWVASQLRYFDDNPKYPSTYLAICVSQLKSPSYAKTDASFSVQYQHLVLNTSSFSVSEIPNGSGLSYNSPFAGLFMGQIIFYKGSYCTVVTIQGKDAARSLTMSLAMADYHLLPA